jgi:hypothetical protein
MDGRRTCTHRERAVRVGNVMLFLVLLADLEEGFLCSSASREGGSTGGIVGATERECGG